MNTVDLDKRKATFAIKAELKAEKENKKRFKHLI